jgi:hypothetical protein
MSVAVAIGLLGTCPGLAASNDPPATGAKLSGDAIKAAWFDGKPFNATAPDGTIYKFVFQPDGHATKALASKKGGNAVGFWRVIAEGYCVRWTGTVREKCFNVRVEADKTNVRFGKEFVAVWSR